MTISGIDTIPNKECIMKKLYQSSVLHHCFSTLEGTAGSSGKRAVLKNLSLSAVIFSLSVGSQPVFADQPAEKEGAAVHLEDIEVVALPENHPELFKQNYRRIEIPQSLSVMNSVEMEKQGVQSVDDVMKMMPGVTVVPHTSWFSSYAIRGFDVQSFEINGTHSPHKGEGYTSFDHPDISIVERMEVLRGANSLLHGAGTPSGTVNMVLKRPGKEKFSGSITAGAGSWDNYHTTVDIGSPLNESGSLRVRGVINYRDRKFFTDYQKEDALNLYLIGEWDITAQTTWGLGVSHQSIDAPINPYGIPFYSDGSDVGLSRSTYLGAAWNRFDKDITRIFSDITHTFNDNWKIKGSINYTTEEFDLDYSGSFPKMAPSVTAANPPADGWYTFYGNNFYQGDNTHLSFDLHTTGKIHFLNRQHDVMFGVNYHDMDEQDYRDKVAQITPALLNPFSWDPHSVSRPATTHYTPRNRYRTEELGFYASGRWTLFDSLKLITGLRGSTWEYQYNDEPSVSIDTELTPFAGLVYQFSDTFSIYASYAESFEPGSYRGQDGSVVEPSTGRNYETGIKGEFMGGRLNSSLAFFWMEQKNRPVSMGIYPDTYYISIGEVETRGIEAEISGNISDLLLLSASYTYRTDEFDKETFDLYEIRFGSRTPRHLLKIWGDYTLPWLEERINIGGGVYLQSKMEGEYDSNLTQDGYALVNALAGYRFTENISAAFNINNIFDENYYARLYRPDVMNFYGEPRSFMFTLKVNF